MKLYRTTQGIILETKGKFYHHASQDWDTLFNDDDILMKLLQLVNTLPETQDAQQLLNTGILPPIVSQELWACGVTYYRSKVGRQEEAKDAGGGDFYEKVYNAERPEVFFKANAHRVVGHNAKVRIRKDSTWDVPEPELTLAVTSSGKIIGYTIGNDMSSRSIEGENPLYLPQAKTYDGCAALGPCIYLINEALPVNTNIHLDIHRDGQVAYTGDVTIEQIKRTPQELVSFVFRECSFPAGCFIMTGTGIVPEHDFTLRSGDEINITIDHIGILINTVE